MTTSSGRPAPLRSALRLLIDRPWLAGPFALVAFVELLLLAVLHLAPRPPVSWVLAPFIRSFWGEAFLHYPDDLRLLPHLLHAASAPVDLLVGAWAAAATAGRLRLWLTGETTGRGYASFLAATLLTYAALQAALAAVPRIAGALPLSSSLATPALFVGAAVVTAAVDAIFLWTIPAMAAGERLPRALALSIRRSARRPVRALGFAAWPVLLSFGAAALRLWGAPRWTGDAPELVMLFLAVEIAAGALGSLLLVAVPAIDLWLEGPVIVSAPRARAEVPA